MRAFILFLYLFLVFTSCSKSVDTPKVYSDSKGTSISFTNSTWSTAKSTTGIGTVNLKISGSTNADRLTIRTLGESVDGLINDLNVKLDSKKSFNESVEITYTSTSVPTSQFELNTEVKAYRGSDTLIVSLSSGKLKY
jgi:hypothetical protein